MPTLEYWIDSAVAVSRWRPLLTDSEVWHSFENLKMMINERDQQVSLLLMVDKYEILPPQTTLQARKVGCFDLPNVGRIAIVTAPHQIPQLMKIMRHITARPVKFFTTVTDALNYLHGLAATA